MEHLEILDKLNCLRLSNAIKLQERMMELCEELRHDKETIESVEESSDEEEDDEDFMDDEESPIREELFLIVEAYKVMTQKVE